MWKIWNLFIKKTVLQSEKIVIVRKSYYVMKLNPSIDTILTPSAAICMGEKRHQPLIQAGKQTIYRNLT